MIALCPTCEGRLIEKHPRLYRKVEPMEPFPGIMRICEGCTKQDGLRCTDPSTKRNGGPGLLITFAQPVTGIACGPRGRSHRLILWREHPTECVGREERA